MIALVFSMYDRIGTVGGVLCYLADNRIQVGIRLREGPDRGELTWRRPSLAVVQNMLRNPAYAGIYAYGRSSGDPRRRQPGRPYSGRTRVESGQWLVYLPGVLPSYISVEQYEANVRRMDANRSRAQSMGAVRDGPALLAGLIRCGRCGMKMTVRYQRGPGGVLQPGYVCGTAAVTWPGKRCRGTASPSPAWRRAGLRRRSRCTSRPDHGQGRPNPRMATHRATTASRGGGGERKLALMIHAVGGLAWDSG